MLWTLTVISLVLWVTAMVTGIHASVAIHALLAFAIVVMLIILVRSRRVLLRT